MIMRILACEYMDLKHIQLDKIQHLCEEVAYYCI
jgi:hypothetical protein